MLFGILFNLAVIIIIIKNRLLRRQVTNLFLLNMAISDLLNLTFNTVGYYFWMNVMPSPSGVIFNQYYLGENMCYASTFFTSKNSMREEILVVLSFQMGQPFLYLGHK